MRSGTSEVRGYDSGTILTILGTLVTPPHAPRLFAPPGVLVLFALINVLPATVWAQDEGRPDLPTPDQLNVQVIPVTESIRVDGILDEAVWQHAVPATRFWQYAPLDRVPATENTEVRVVQDDRALYFGIICHDANPKGIIALDMRRDAPLSNDDHVGIYLDTYHDHRNFYYKFRFERPTATARVPYSVLSTRAGSTAVARRACF